MKARKSNGIFLTLLLFLSLPFHAVAQLPYTRLYYPLGENESHRITKLHQDRNGILWLGSTNGVYAFNGNASERIALNDTALDNTAVTAFAEHDGSLWIGFANGRAGVIRNYAFSAFEPEEGLPRQAITSLTFDATDRLWLATAGEGIYIHDGRRLYNINRDDGLPDDNVHALLMRDSAVWAGTDRGLVRILFANGEKDLTVFSRSEGLPDAVVTTLVQDDHGMMWLGLLDNGLVRFDEKNFTVQSQRAFAHWDKGRVRAAQWTRNRCWLVTDYQGVWVFDTTLDSVYAQPMPALPAQRFHDALLDREGLIWLCASNRLYKTSGELLQRYPVLAAENENIQAVLTRRSGEVWFATNRGLFRLQQGRVTPVSFSNNAFANVLTMHEDESGHVWIGTFGDGLWHYQSSTRVLTRITITDGLPDNSVLHVTGDGNAIWVATLGGVSRIAFAQGQRRIENFTEANGLQSAYVYRVFIDSRRRVWLGTDGRGVNLWNGERFTNPVTRGTLPSQVVYSIAEDALGQIWVSTARNGLYRIDGDTAYNYGTADGLDDYNITGLAADTTGNLFVMHNDGIENLNVRNGVFTFYGRLMQAGDLQAGLNAVAFDGHHTFWAGTREGLLKFSPPGARKHVAPLVHMRGVQVLSGDASAITGNVFRHTQNFLRFRYDAVWNVDPDALTFRYRLSGPASTDWIETRDRDVVLPRLDYGRYELVMHAGLVGAYNGAAAHTFAFRVRPAWWQTWWFYALATALCVGLLASIVAVRERAMVQQQQVAQLKLRAEYETLRNQVNPHFLFNAFNTLVAAIEENPTAAVVYVQHLSDFFRRMLEVREKPLVTLADELELARHYIYLQQQRHGANFSVETDVNGDATRYALPPLTLQLLLENAFKHNAVSRSTPLRIRIASHGDVLTVENNLNPKSNREAGTGIGLENIRSRVRLLGRGEVVCEKTNHTFTVRVPLIETDIA